MQRKKALIGAVILLVLIALPAVWWQNARQLEENSHSLVLYGNVDIREVQLTINGSEHIAQMLVQEGEQVEQGQLLAELKTETLQAAVARAEALVAAQQAVVDRLLAGNRPEEIRRAQDELTAAEALERNAHLTHQRLQQLLKNKLVSPEDVDKAAAAAKAARAQRAAAAETLALARKGPRSEDIAAAEAALKADQAQLALARYQLDNARLLAPARGIITNRILEPGDMASPQKPLYTLALTDPLWVRTYVSGTDLGQVRQGMRAEVSTDSFPGKTYRAWVGYISPSAEFTPKSVETREVRTHLVYQLRVFVCNPEGELRLGMPATVHLSLDQPATPVQGDPCQDTP